MKEILESLAPQQKESLLYGFNNEQTVFIEYKPGLFIGVFIPDSSNFEVSERKGNWAIGRLKKGKSE